MISKTVYLKHLVIKIYSRKKAEYYKILRWTKDGMTQFTLETGKFDGDIEKLKSQVLSNVGGK